MTTVRLSAVGDLVYANLIQNRPATADVVPQSPVLT
jgi:hypothetical protein